MKAEDEDVAKGRAGILEEVRRIVTERGTRYGSPEQNFGQLALHWRAYFVGRFGVELALGPEDVALMMTLFKIARLEGNMSHWDSWVDGLGYLTGGADIVLRKSQQQQQEAAPVVIQRPLTSRRDPRG